MNALAEIRRCVREGTLAHAYIIEEENAEARGGTLTQIVQAILCQNADVQQRPCGVCPDCRRVQAHSHEDVVYMAKTGARGYLVNEGVVPFLEDFALNPYGDRKIGVIEDANLLPEAAQNKILKTLEEPYPGNIILLTTSNRESLLPTIRSRCVLLRNQSEEVEVDSAESLEIWNQKYFFQYRKAIEKTFKSAEEALNFLEILEQEAYRLQKVEPVLRIEEAKKDIQSGMGWKQALKRLYLELKQR